MMNFRVIATGVFLFCHLAQANASGVLAAPVGADSYYPLVYGTYPTKQQLSALGKKLFFDVSLSSSGKMSCATCHNPQHAYGPDNSLPVQRGGTYLDQSGFRNTPSLTYTNAITKFTERFLEPEVTGGQDDEGPTGGHTWDGRANTGHEQALLPFLDPNEMANDNLQAVALKISKSNYSDEFRKIVSAPNENVFDNPDNVIGWITIALESFEQSATDFHPFTSKYDAYLRDEANLTVQESRGLGLFNDPKKGNCASCHISSRKNPNSHLPVFTDFGFVALGIPRNQEIPANADTIFYDLGLCGPLRTDFKNRSDYCGLFRTPSLRNVALRKSFFHNGAFHSLKEVLRFYVTRDTSPEKWYRLDEKNHVIKFDDLPKEFHNNVNTDVPFKPFNDKRPRLTDAEIEDVIAFLNTLTDGYALK